MLDCSLVATAQIAHADIEMQREQMVPEASRPQSRSRDLLPMRSVSPPSRMGLRTCRHDAVLLLLASKKSGRKDLESSSASLLLVHTSAEYRAVPDVARP